MPDIKELVRSYVEEATPLLRQYLPAARCLPGTRICLGVMKAFNVAARPVSVETIAMNAAACSAWTSARTDQGDVVGDVLGDVVIASSFPPHLPATSFPPTGIKIGYGGRKNTTPGGWPGHLVTVVDDRWLIDSALLQVNRPESGIVVPDILAFQINPGFLRRHVALAVGISAVGQVVYSVRPDNSYKHQEAFTKVDVMKIVIDQIVARMGG